MIANRSLHCTKCAWIGLSVEGGMRHVRENVGHVVTGERSDESTITIEVTD